ncbi:MAG: YceI family protein, partial [Pseudomonadota bacterium]
MRQRLLLIAAVVLLGTACQAPVTQPEDTSATATGARADVTADADSAAGTQTLWIDPAQSWLRVRVYKSGRLARFGHNHVMLSEVLRGKVALGDDTADTQINVTLPLNSFVVDDPAARAAEGAEFDGEIPEKDRAATRANMLGDALLNAAAYPDLTLKSVRVDGALPDVVIVADISLAGQTRQIELPVAVQIADDRIVATGDVVVTHADLGLGALLHHLARLFEALLLQVLRNLELLLPLPGG